jgi:hypothetical protein
MSSEPPESSQGTKSTRPKHHAISFRPSNRSIPELINDPANKSPIVNEQTARAELETRLFITPAVEINTDVLATALLDFTVQANSLMPMHINILKAIAILIFKVDHERKSRLIANSVSILLDSPITWLEELIENHTNMEDNATSLNMTLEKTGEAMKTISNKLDTIKTSFEAIKNLQDNHLRQDFLVPIRGLWDLVSMLWETYLWDPPSPHLIIAYTYF